MDAGASGTGRMTFVNTLCELEALKHKMPDNHDSAYVEGGIRNKPCNGTSLFPIYFAPPTAIAHPHSIYEHHNLPLSICCG